MDTKNKMFVVIGSVALLASAGVGGYALFATKDSTSGATTGMSSQTSSTSTNTSTTFNGYVINVVPYFEQLIQGWNVYGIGLV